MGRLAFLPIQPPEPNPTHNKMSIVPSVADLSLSSTLPLKRWKQQDIHQKRQERTIRIAKLKTEAALNETLRPRIVAMIDKLKSAPSKEAISSYASLVHQLTTNPSSDKPPTGAPNQPTYDVMLLHLLEQVWKEAKEIEGEPKAGGEDQFASTLGTKLRYHNESLDKRTEECRREAEKEEAEEKKKITSEGIKDGFSSGVSWPCINGILFTVISALKTIRHPLVSLCPFGLLTTSFKPVRQQSRT